MLLTLEPGADAAAALETLRQRKELLANCEGDPGAYLQWALESASTLRNRVRRSDIDRLFLTPSLWRLHELVGRTPALMMRDLIHLELQDRGDALDKAHTALQKEIHRWTYDRDPLAVVDTSVFLHHEQKIGEIDYHAIVYPGVEPIRLVVPELVVDELDRLKESGTEHVRWRARLTLAVIDELLPNPIGRATVQEREPGYLQAFNSDRMPRHQVTVEVLYNDPHHVALADDDAEIIDRAVALQAYAGRTVHLITMDTGMSLNARRITGLQVHKIKKDPGEEPPQRGPRRRRDADTNPPSAGAPPQP